MKSIVYRIQNSKGIGPYNGHDELLGPQWKETPHNKDTGRPFPHEDEKLADQLDGLNRKDRLAYLFGFESMEQLNKWFTPVEIQNLSQFGYEIVQIPVEQIDIVYGNTQLIFKYKEPLSL